MPLRSFSTFQVILRKGVLLRFILISLPKPEAALFATAFKKLPFSLFPTEYSVFLLAPLTRLLLTAQLLTAYCSTAHRLHGHCTSYCSTAHSLLLHCSLLTAQLPTACTLTAYCSTAHCLHAQLLTAYCSTDQCLLLDWLTAYTLTAHGSIVRPRQLPALVRFKFLCGCLQSLCVQGQR